MCSPKSIIYLPLLLVTIGCVSAGKHWAHPEQQQIEPVIETEDVDGSPVKTCEMVCRMKPRTGKKDWRQETFWTILNGIYTCRWQGLGKKLLQNRQYADIVIDFVDVDNNSNKTRFGHSSVLSYVSEAMKKSVDRAIAEHVTNYTRPRERLPSIQWPPLPTEAVDAMLEYIYTNRMTKFDPSTNIIALYVAAFTADHKEMMKIIESYLDDSMYTVEQLNQLVLYLRYAHRNGLSQLKQALTMIARKILKMTEIEFERFIKDICESNGYQRSWQALPGGQIRPTDLLPDTAIPTRPPTGFPDSGIGGGGITGGIGGARPDTDVRPTGSGIGGNTGIGGTSGIGGISGGSGNYGNPSRDSGIGLVSSDIRPNIGGRSANLIQENKEEHKTRRLPPYEDHP